MTSPRIQVRRQSTLPAYPDYQQTRFPIPQVYSHSPEDVEEDMNSISMYPTPRQSSYSSYASSSEQVYQRQLPTSPNKLNFNKSPDNNSEENEQISPRKFLRQSTLPNPDKHIKLLPTSPPSKSPQFKKRSPEFHRQMTISNPEGMSTLSIPQFSPKFLPISPKQKQSFLFSSNNSAAPRTFLSQQNFPPMSEEHPPTSPFNPNRDHAKMIKVRSHSNEEYSFNKGKNLPTQQQHEGNRRLLPEIPTRARSRSPNRLVRQDRVSKDEIEKRFKVQTTLSENLSYENEDTADGVECVIYTFEPQSVDLTSFEEENLHSLIGVNDEFYASLDTAQANITTCESGAFDEKNSKDRKFKADTTMRSVSEESPVSRHRILPRRSFSQPEKECLKKSDHITQIGSDNVNDVANKVKSSNEPKYNFHKVIEMKRNLECGDAKKSGNTDRLKEDMQDLLINDNRREVSHKSRFMCLINE